MVTKNFSIMRLIDHLMVGISFFIVGLFLKKPNVIVSSFPPIETSFSLFVIKNKRIKMLFGLSGCMAKLLSKPPLVKI